MQVDLIDHMGSDITVVNAARVSFAKESSYVYDRYEQVWELSESDRRLIAYLAKHNHWTPFAHPQITFRIKAPLFVARQLGKHQVGLVWNEVSRRYVDSEPEFYNPILRKRGERVKQGSSDEFPVNLEVCERLLSYSQDIALHGYKRLLQEGVCPEQARMILPQSMMTEWYWTGSLAAFSRVVGLRLDPHSQRETQEIAGKLETHLELLFPVSWKALKEAKDD